MRLLLIEDDAMVARAIRKGLSQAGFAVDLVSAEIPVHHIVVLAAERGSGCADDPRHQQAADNGGGDSVLLHGDLLKTTSVVARTLTVKCRYEVRNPYLQRLRIS